MTGEQMLQSFDELLEGGPGSSTLLSCDQQEATDFRAFCYRNGIEVEIQKEARDVYRFKRTEDEGVTA